MSPLEARRSNRVEARRLDPPGLRPVLPSDESSVSICVTSLTSRSLRWRWRSAAASSSPATSALPSARSTLADRASGDPFGEKPGGRGSVRSPLRLRTGVHQQQLAHVSEVRSHCFRHPSPHQAQHILASVTFNRHRHRVLQAISIPSLGAKAICKGLLSARWDCRCLGAMQDASKSSQGASSKL